MVRTSFDRVISILAFAIIMLSSHTDVVLADQEPIVWWKQAVSAPGYGKATAHDPQFNDKALWPQLTGKEKYLKQEWSKGRLYIWANPGQSGNLHAKRSALDPSRPEHWIDAATGRPASELVLDENTDLFFPASKQVYQVGFRTTNVKETIRHVTIEPGAEFIGGGDGRGRVIHGNVWVKKGGRLYAQGSTALVGDKHTFFRNDNVYGSASQYFNFTKPPEVTVEFLGHSTTSDEWRLESGTVIIGPDSVMQPGRTATPYIKPPGTLVLLDGAYWGKTVNEWHVMMDMDMAGTIQAGLPERPLTRDATFALSVRNWAKLPLQGSNEKEKYDTRKVSAIFKTGSRIRTIAAPGSKAKLNITRFEFGGPYCNRNWVVMVGCYPQGIRVSDKELSAFADPAFKAQFDSKPFKMLLYFQSGVTVEGPVEFNHLPEGGILCAEANPHRAWSNVTFGPDNMAPPGKLFQQMDRIDRGGAF